MVKRKVKKAILIVRKFVFCDICGQELLNTNAIQHHIDPSMKTKEPGALAKADRNERSGLLWVCRPCHGRIHAKLQKPKKYFDEYGKLKTKKIYYTDNPEGAIYK